MQRKWHLPIKRYENEDGHEEDGDVPVLGFKLKPKLWKKHKNYKY